MSVLKGPVRFRFRVAEEDVDVLIQGDAEWVNALREEIGLLDVGWVQPMAATGRTFQEQEEPDTDDEESIEADGEEPVLLQSDAVVELPGPPPDPSRIPTVRRIIG